MKDVKVTIVVPVYNVEPYIAECLRSVAEQDYSGSIECLLVDDCGTDNSMEVAKDFINSYHGMIEFRIFRHEHNRGLSAARNTGIKYAKGDYIYFLDSDDEITKDCIDKLVTPLLDKTYDFVIGGYRCIKACPPLLLNNGIALYDDEILRSYYMRKWYMMVCGKLCNVQFLKKNQLLLKEGLLHEDELWSFQLACLAKSMYVVNEESYVYKIREGSITQNVRTQERKAIAFQRIIQYMIDFVLANHIKSKYSYWIIYRNLYSLWLKTPIWTNKNVHECNAIVVRQRKYLCRIPYMTRLTSCMVGVRPMLFYGAILLPTAFYNSYNSVLRYLQRYMQK